VIELTIHELVIQFFVFPFFPLQFNSDFCAALDLHLLRVINEILIRMDMYSSTDFPCMTVAPL